MFEVLHGDCLDVMRSMQDNSVDSIVTDPPYGWRIMGNRWDYDVPSVEVWNEALRVLKPGCHVLCACGTRTQHRMAVNIEDGGFEIRDVVSWIYGSGFPKSLDIGKAIDRKFGAEREKIGRSPHFCAGRGQYTKGDWGMNSLGGDADTDWLTAPATPEAKQWEGWGTTLKPSCEFWTLARKPFSGSVADNVLKWGTGGLNINGCRVPFDNAQAEDLERGRVGKVGGSQWRNGTEDEIYTPSSNGRFPANVMHDGSDEVVSLFPESNGGARPKKSNTPPGALYNGGWGNIDNEQRVEMGNGSAARFFYCPKASKAERDAGLDELEARRQFTLNAGGREAKGADGEWDDVTSRWIGQPRRNTHATVKPIALMRYLVRMITPPGGLVLDPYNGSGTTGCAAVLEGMRYIGIERELEFVEISRLRIEHWQGQSNLQPSIFDNKAEE